MKNVRILQESEVLSFSGQVFLVLDTRSKDMSGGVTDTNEVRLFVGAPIQYQSEHDCLRAVVDALTTAGKWAYCFANFHACGRQIDLAVLTENTTLVIEAKGYRLPLQGDKNGMWVQRGPYGERKIGNAYQQALDAKNALRDAIQRHCHISGYPHAAVISTPTIPDGSTLTPGDFKVTVGCLTDIVRLLAAPTELCLTADACEHLAKQLNLDRAITLDAALSQDIFAAQNACNAYLCAFNEFHAPVAAKLVDDSYKYDAHEIDASQVRSMLGMGTQGLLIHGPAGCGKSLLTASCAIACIATDSVPILVSAKDFEGEFLRLIDREAVLLNARSANRLIAISRSLGKRIMLFLDGYNECRDDLKINLTRILKVFSRRYNAGIVISSQQNLARNDLLSLRTVEVARPTEALKAAIAVISAHEDRSGSVRRLLGAVNSGLEASLVGQVGAFLTVGASRFALFDMYARRKLGVAAAQGIRVLSDVAATLVERTCFSLSVREFDRLCDAEQLDDKARQHLTRSRLLQMRGDRISFAHELFFAAFTAEAVIRSADGNLDHILAALASPRFFLSKVFIFGAVEDDRMLYAVLDRTADYDLLAACANGECGLAAQSTARQMIDRAMQDTLAEAAGLRFQIVGEGWNSVSIDGESLRPRLKETFDRLLPAIGQQLLNGKYLDLAMAACGKLDESIATFSAGFAEEPKAKRVKLQTEVFHSAYVMDRKAAISQLVYAIHSGILGFRREAGASFDSALEDAWSRAESPGQYYFLLGLTRCTSSDKMPAPVIVRLLKNLWAYPYHFQLEVIDCAGYAQRSEEPHRTDVIDALQALLGKLGPVVNSFLFHALDAFGALNDDKQNHIPTIQHEINNALTTEGSDGEEAAWALYCRQFDHPFDTAYWEEIQGLDEARQKALFAKACRGAEAPHVSFMGILIRRLAEFNDPQLGPTIARWTHLPDKRSVMPQDAIQAFVEAHQALGRLDVELPQSRGELESAVDIALLACGELEYWSCRQLIDTAQRSRGIDIAHGTLLDYACSASAGALLLTTSRYFADDGNRVSLVQRYPELSVAICRVALTRRDEQVSYFAHERPGTTESIGRFAIQVLAEVGDISDLQLLRGLCDLESYGTSALRAIEKIEERMSYRPT
ncbi:hypothetical protein GTP91_14815 [Rugamonas sp. FT82W]|uniref:NERD domain-containing protein n=1 Tax=Duganella vulcania TaxID=2692166 RepID=A0A845G6E5_9BURK|nr:NERD domain-containing protein [Duganella vulcania]MYM88439.1 hypothetical protein [Duganella vulcania]